MIDLRDRLAAGDQLDYAAIVPRAEFDALAAAPTQFGLPPQALSLEGYLHPGEYRFDVEATATDIITQMIKATTDRLQHGGMVAEGVGSYWPFATGTRVAAANLLLRQIVEASRTRWNIDSPANRPPTETP